GRDPNLPTQALHAIQRHFQPTIMPTVSDGLGISQFELTETFFSSPPLRAYARGGPPPVLPQGTTESGIRVGPASLIRHSYQERSRAPARSAIAVRCSIRPTRFSLTPPLD